ncbi:tyrosine-type recombinase/integrase [Haliangium ochraceum]|uniref:tyrosine-type recombinase/integrase n=1 Tax=Haliangium ochraceum TaxID=80816 RepID=UPI00019B961D|nr:site-specific integrase [Haliangium ochraceum]
MFKLENGTFRIRGKVRDPRTGKAKEVDRVVSDVSAQRAAYLRAEMMDALRVSAEPEAKRVRVGEYALSWMRSKALKLSPGTARTYADALEDHILPAFGDLFYDALRKQDVQRWVDDALTNGWVSPSGEHRRYSRSSVHAWFRVLRTMTRDAMDDLGLRRDPTLRISFPDATEPKEANTLTPDELARFLGKMRERFPQHYALTVTLAYTGLRFCHASALQWADWNEKGALIRVVRKQVRGRVGPVTRKKQAPHEYPVEPELAGVLREHRAWMVREQAPGLAEGWMFPSSVGTLRAPSSLNKAWKRCLDAAGVSRRFAVHGLRYTFTELVRRADVDAAVRRALTGHVTEEMQRHYSTVGLDEKRAAVAGVYRLVPAHAAHAGTGTGGGPTETWGTEVGTGAETTHGRLASEG